MSEWRPADVPMSSRRLGPVAILVGIAIVIGLALMTWAVARSPGGFPGGRSQPVATLPNYDPAPPLGIAPSPAASFDPLTLAARESALAARLAALESRTAAVATDAVGAAGQAARAESVLVAVATRRAIERGAPLGYLEEQLRIRFGTTQPRATTILIQAARQPVTLETLRQGLDANAADLVGGGGGDWFSSLGREFGRLVVIRPAGAPSSLPAERLMRARRLLDAGQVEASLAEVRRLPGAVDAGAWMAAANRYVETRHALDAIESVALMGQSPVPPPFSAIDR